MEPIIHAVTLFARASSLLAAVGCALSLAAAGLVGRFRRVPVAALRDWPSVSVLKPLCGDEPGLLERLLAICDQAYPGVFELVLGVQNPHDPSVSIVAALQALRPRSAISLVVERQAHGSNRKVSNLVNIAARARHDVFVIADSDIEVEADYLSRTVAALDPPGVGAVSCLYVGTASPAVGARLSACAINAHFLPGVVLGLALGAARPCFGATIALRRATLEALGGFRAFADKLADDYAIGDAVRAAGLDVAIPDFAVSHACAESDLAGFLRHQLRAARTIRTIDPGGYFGSVILNPLPFALLGLLAGSLFSFVVPVATLLCRHLLHRAVRRRFGAPRQAWWVLPVCDLLIAFVFCASFCGRSVMWRGQRLNVLPDGTAALT